MGLGRESNAAGRHRTFPVTRPICIDLIGRIGDRFASIKRRRDPFGNCLLNSDSHLIGRFAAVVPTANPIRLTVPCESVIVDRNGRSLRVDLVCRGRFVPVAGCVASCNPRKSGGSPPFGSCSPFSHAPRRPDTPTAGVTTAASHPGPPRSFVAAPSSSRKTQRACVLATQRARSPVKIYPTPPGRAPIMPRWCEKSGLGIPRGQGSALACPLMGLRRARLMLKVAHHENALYVWSRRNRNSGHDNSGRSMVRRWPMGMVLRRLSRAHGLRRPTEAKPRKGAPSSALQHVAKRQRPQQHDEKANQ